MCVPSVTAGNNRGYAADVLITYTARRLNVPTAAELLNLFTHPDIVADTIIAPSTYSIRHDSIAALRITPLSAGSVATASVPEPELQPPRMVVIAPSVDLNRFAPKAVEYTDSPSDASLVASKPFVVGFVARLAVEKNVGLFILSAFEIIHELRGKHRAMDVTALVRFIVIGDGHLKTHLMDLSVMLEIVDYIDFAGWLSGEPYVTALRAIDVLVNPSVRAWSETFCIANIEALAMNIPLVTFGVGGVGEYIDLDFRRENDEGEELGISPIPDLFTIANNVVILNDAVPNAITAAVMHLHSSGALRRHLGAAGRTVVERYFSADLQMGQYEALYRDIIARHASKAS